MAKLCPACRQSVFFAEEVKVEDAFFHKDCLICASCRKQLNSANVCYDKKTRNAYCQACFSRETGVKEKPPSLCIEDVSSVVPSEDVRKFSMQRIPAKQPNFDEGFQPMPDAKSPTNTKQAKSPQNQEKSVSKGRVSSQSSRKTSKTGSSTSSSRRKRRNSKA